MKKSDIGLVGLAVMGENLAINLESKGYRVSLYNRLHPHTPQVVDRFLASQGEAKRFYPTYSLAELVESLERPRKILLMIRAGEPVDETLAALLPLLSRGDIVIDGGNSDYRDTRRRQQTLREKGIYLVGCGISGGEEGALHGPSIMPGGDEAVAGEVLPLLQAIAARLDDGTPCCAWTGPDGSGHFVKTVHNGIEYGDMQLIAETYSLLRIKLKNDHEAMADTFEQAYRAPLFIGYNVQTNQVRSAAALEASLVACLYTKMLPAVVQRAQAYRGKPLPPVVEQAIALYALEHPEVLSHFPISQQVVQQVKGFVKQYVSHPPKDIEALRKEYGQFYPFYYYFQNQVDEAQLQKYESKMKGGVN